MNFFAISCLTTAILTFILGIFVLTRKGVINKLWFLNSLAIFLWTIGLFGSVVSQHEGSALFSQRVLYIGTILLPAFFFHYTLYLTNYYDTNRIKLKIVYLATLFFLIFSFSSLFLKNILPRNSFGYWPVATGGMYAYFVIFFVAVLAYSLFLLYSSTRINVGYKKKRLQYMLYASLVGIIGGSTNFLLDFDVDFYPAGNFFVSLYAILMAYAIVKYRLMNIRLIVTRSILYTVLVGAVASFFSLSVFLASTYLGANTQVSKIFVYIVAATIVVFALDPVKRVWARITDSIFYKDKIDYQKVLQRVGLVLAREIDLQDLLQKFVDSLVKELKIKKVSFWLATNDHYELTAKSGVDIATSLSVDFINFVKKHRKLIVLDEFLRDKENFKENTADYQAIDYFIQEAETKKIEMVLPIVETERLTAIMFFGAKQSGDLYSSEEINFFEVLMPQIATALEKSKLYEDVEELNRSLQVKVEERTKSLSVANLSLEERNKFLTTMQGVSTLISRSLDLNKVNQAIANSIASELGYVGGLLSFVDKESNSLKMAAITQNEFTAQVLKMLPQDPFNYRSLLQEGYNLGVQTFMSGKINMSAKISDFLSPPVSKAIIDTIQKVLGVKSVVCIPVYSEGGIIGVVQFFLKIEQTKISSMDIETMTALTNQVGIVSSNLKLYNNLQKANRDLQEANMHLRDLDKAKSEFLSIASHQLRTPISAIKGYLSMLMDGDFGKVTSPRIKEVLAGVYESSNRLARQVDIFLDVSRIESGHLKLDKHPIQINNLIDSVVAELQNQVIKKGLKLNFKADKSTPMIVADPDKIRNVIINLVDNAVKYTPQGAVIVSTKYDQDFLTFMVKDTGIGIDPAEVGGLFRKFVRGSGVAQIHTGGSGLGLFIAQKMIKEHGGQIWAESEGKGLGSTFQFTLPFKDGLKLATEEIKKA
ncbi:MAG: hypothetical protein C3F02_00410 [Parcubacteria group bacterium]|nr:MAG: hypothetical protein C3F02_00410 [Parcubacteria group bacterium]